MVHDHGGDDRLVCVPYGGPLLIVVAALPERGFSWGCGWVLPLAWVGPCTVNIYATSQFSQRKIQKQKAKRSRR